MAASRELFKYEAAWPLYALNWSHREDQRFRLAVGSFLEDYNNRVEIIQLNEATEQFEVRAVVEHPYPPTKVAFLPDVDTGRPDLLATSGDYLRLWEIAPGGGPVSLRALLNNNKNSEFCAPLTSFDWNEVDPTLLGTCSIDTTCTIWDVERGQAVTQLIAHDKEVYDISFAPRRDVFASVGADGSMRLFDLRSLEHLTIVYESPELVPLLRLGWNKLDENYLAAVAMDSRSCIVVDVRVPSVPAAELGGHTDAVNAMAWAPHSPSHLCTGADDTQALIWDLTNMSKRIDEPILAYGAEGEINHLQWSALQPEWIAIALSNSMQILRV